MSFITANVIADTISEEGVRITTLDCQDITAFVEFMSEAMPTDFLNDLKGLVDTELTKRRTLETEEEV